jgi:hypothetical protein
MNDLYEPAAWSAWFIGRSESAIRSISQVARRALGLARWWHSVTGPGRLTVDFRLTAGTGRGPSLPGSSPAGRCPMTTAAPSTALATIQPAFTDAERLALAGFLAGYRGLTREATRTGRFTAPTTSSWSISTPTASRLRRRPCSACATPVAAIWPPFTLTASNGYGPVLSRSHSLWPLAGARCRGEWTAMMLLGAYRCLPRRPITAAPMAPARFSSSARANAGVQVYLAARLRLR